MSDILKHIGKLEQLPIPNDLAQRIRKAKPENLIVLDKGNDPDPFGEHKMPLVDRLKAMGWPE